MVNGLVHFLHLAVRPSAASLTANVAKQCGHCVRVGMLVISLVAYPSGRSSYSSFKSCSFMSSSRLETNLLKALSASPAFSFDAAIWAAFCSVMAALSRIQHESRRSIHFPEVVSSPV